MNHYAGRNVLLMFLLCLPGSGAADEAADQAAWDWQFRESLGAIRDWEAILGREAATPAGPPTIPAPAGGASVEWPNPIPRALIPPEDRDCRIRLRLVEGGVEVSRIDGRAQQSVGTHSLPETIEGYQHPGAGGKDQWYHHYQRKFDRLTSFRVKPASFAVEVATPCDFPPGKNVVPLVLRSFATEPLTVQVSMRQSTTAADRECSRQRITLAPEAEQSLALPFQQNTEGGGLLVVTIDANADTYWFPLLTHVEGVAAVLQSVEQILADVPDAGAADRLDVLKQRANAFRSTGMDEAGTRWRTLFEELSRLRDERLLARLDFDAILFLKRKPFFSEQPFMDAHHLFNRPGGGIYRLQPVRPSGKVTPVVDGLGEGVYRDLALHWDAQRFLFAFGNGSDRWDGSPSYHIHEARMDGTGVRQLTSGPKNDCEPLYLPSGDIAFTSDRSEHFVMCGGDRHVANLFTMRGDGSNLRQLSFNVFNDFNPSLLPDGRILYSRWEYNERSVTSLHNPFTIHPDGTMMAPYYGNATIRPNVVMFPRPVPGSRKIMALFTAHHGQTHGAVGLIDPRRGIDGPAPLAVLTPQVPISGEKVDPSWHGWFSDPMPLSETTWLCSYTPTVRPWVERSWALYVADRHGNLALVYRDPEISCAEPVPLVPRPRPVELAAAAADEDRADGEATLVVADVAIGLLGVPRGTAAWLRVLEDVPRKGVHQGGVICTSGTQTYTIKRVLGMVPIESDGSAHFVVPANRNVYFEVLDRNQREIQRMRSVVCLKPGERRGCIGCHEPRNMAPPAVVSAGRNKADAFRREPSRPRAPPWGTAILSFLRDVQPVLNARCVACHAYQRAANAVILTDDLTDRFTIGYEELLPYLHVANAMRWDHPDDVEARPPYTYGSKSSPLVELLARGHHGVELSEEEWERLTTWIDANGVYYDRYETDDYPTRQIFTGPIRETVGQVYARRCESCHGKGDGVQDTWWLSLNRRDVRASRALAAPLARSAGGWQQCEEVVFADTEDPDYRLLLDALAAIGRRLAERPRADLLSLRGSPAERQQVAMPPPPAPCRPVEAEEGGDWIALSDLAWESARSGWTPNGDGLPRRDRDVTDQPLRLARKRYAKGIGTHAPSEIVYALEGKYARFVAVVGGAEQGGSVVFRVFGDQELLAETGTLLGLGEVKTIDVSVAGVRRLRLVVTDAGDHYYADMANWAGARLLKAEPGEVAR